MSWSLAGIGAAAQVAAFDLALSEYAGAAEFDLQIALIAFREADAFTLPYGWTSAASQLSGNGTVNASGGIASGLIAWRVRGPSAGDLNFVRGVIPESDPPYGGGGVARGLIVGYRGQAAAPYDAASSATLGASGTTPSATGITTSAGAELIVALAAGGRAGSWSGFDAATDPATNSGSIDTSSAPAAGAWTQRHNSTTTLGASVSLGIADAIRAAAGATGAITAVCSQSARHAMLACAFKLSGARPSAQAIIL